jgi:hypothetical protein
MNNKRLEKIIEQNKKREKESPYNFCDRWCQRCELDKKTRCTIYNDTIECQMYCAGLGKDADDPEIFGEFLSQKYKDIEGKNMNIDLDNIEHEDIDIDEGGLLSIEDFDTPELLPIKKHMEFVQNNDLEPTVKQYHKKAHLLLKDTSYYRDNIEPELQHDLETLSWYHTLLPAKLHRALCGFHEPMSEGDISLHDAVAQFAICKKAISQSIVALRNIRVHYKPYQNKIHELIAILNNIQSRIEILEKTI